jgi:phosphoribosylanthranilate isomerase
MTRRTRVKICGLTRLEDAQLAVDLGADALGFVFWRNSPRAVTGQAAAAIARVLPALVMRVGVFVNTPPRDVAALVSLVGLNAVQLHGDERPDDYADVGSHLIKAVHLSDEAGVADATRLSAGVTPLVDAQDEKRRGGTGQLANWRRAALVAAARPIVLAGGLTAENVGEAIRQVRPWAVDVSSGVEASHGVKSPERLRAFFRSVNAATLEDQ